jgi:hypothetical protein
MNVQIKLGSVLTVLAAQNAVGPGMKQYKDSPKGAFQAIVTGTGALTATVVIKVSNDGINWCTTPLGTITLSGNDSVSDGFASDAPWKFVRADVTALTGTGASVQVLMGV